VALPRIRAARDADAPGLIALIGACFAEYPGCVLDVDGEMQELLAIAAHYARRGGRVWVAEDAGAVVGSVGVVPARGPGGVELQKLYVARESRKRGLGSALCALVEVEGRARGAGYVELWSDTRFTDAHRLYEGRGYRRSGATRELHDKSATVEFHFRREL
jgi:putative acetyltransferase